MAQQQGMHRLVYLRMVGCQVLLEREIARYTALRGVMVGNHLFDAGEDPPDGVDLHDQIARAQWERRERARQAEWERDTTPNEDEARATAAAFAALRAQQGQEQPT